jgi:hypothetical protein
MEQQPGRQPTALYCAVIAEMERRRLELGWPMWQLDDKAGTQDGYYAKCLYPGTPSGKRARWETLQLIVDALFPQGVNVTIEPTHKGDMRSAVSIDKGVNTNAVMVRHWRHSQFFRALGAKGGKAYANNVSARDRSRNARRAARARWARHRMNGHQGQG